jgi:hypothetical protein
MSVAQMRNSRPSAISGSAEHVQATRKLTPSRVRQRPSRSTGSAPEITPSITARTAGASSGGT